MPQQTDWPSMMPVQVETPVQTSRSPVSFWSQGSPAAQLPKLMQPSPHLPVPALQTHVLLWQVAPRQQGA
jgi:hypothetical protein